MTSTVEPDEKLQNPAFNGELADRVLDEIKNNPQNWNQKEWVSGEECGTKFCFAGFACYLSGYRPVFEFEKLWPEDEPSVQKDEKGFETYCGNTVIKKDGVHGYTYATGDFYDPNGEVVSAAEAAADLLGLKDREWALFGASNTLPIIEHMVADLKVGEFSYSKYYH